MENNVYDHKASAVIPPGNFGEEFESLYSVLRARESRIYTDEELENLPGISKAHVHFREWQIRGRSADRLIRHLALKKKALSILEIGCGNGWLSRRLARINGSRVTGLDIHGAEILQAERVFGSAERLQFVKGDIREGGLEGQHFHVIVFAASIQYFPSCAAILHTAMQYLFPGGEIHIMDTIFYSERERDSARERSREYFMSLRLPGMSAFYHHHNLAELYGFEYRVLRRPSRWRDRLFGPDPFYWICIQKGKEK